MGPIHSESSPYRTVRNWFRDKYLALFNNRKVRVLDDPSMVPFEPLKRPENAVPVSQRHIRPAVPKSNLAKAPGKSGSDAPAKTKNPTPAPAATKPIHARQLQQNLLAHCQAVFQKRNPAPESPVFKLLEEFQQKITKGQWGEVLELLALDLHFAGITDFDDFQPHIRKALKSASFSASEKVTPEPPPPQPSRKTKPASPRQKAEEPTHKASSGLGDIDTSELELERKSLKSFHHGQVNIVIGDITRIEPVIGQPLEAIACPYSSAQNRKSGIYSKLAKIEPELKRPELARFLSLQPSGKSIISGSGRLTTRGYSKLILSTLPKPTDGNPRAALVAAYASAIKTATDQKLSSIALPVFTANMGLNPETAVAIAQEAIQEHLAKQSSLGKPRVFLVFPNTAEGREQYTRHLKLNSHEATSDHVTRPEKTRKAHSYKSPPLDERRFLHLMGQVLPPIKQMTVSERMQWLEGEQEHILKQLEKGHRPVKRFRRLNAYLNETFIRLRDLPLSQKEIKAAKHYLGKVDKPLSPYRGNG